LISSTLLDFFVHPALFWLFGRQAAEASPDAADADRLLSSLETVPTGARSSAPSHSSGT
jgi:hypothetical protein